MKIEYNIAGTIYHSRDLSELTLSEYNELYNILEKGLSNEDKMISILLLLTDIPYSILKHVELDSLYSIDYEKILKQPIKVNDITGEIQGRKIKDLKKITLGEFADLDYFLTSQDYKDKRIEYIVALMLLEDYELEDIEKLADKISNEKVSKVLSIFNHFTNWRSDIIKKYEGLFIIPEVSEDEDEDNQETVDSGWIDVIYALSNDNILNVEDVTKQGFIKVLNFMTYKKKEADKQRAKDKLKQNNTF